MPQRRSRVRSRQRFHRFGALGFAAVAVLGLGAIALRPDAITRRQVSKLPDKVEFLLDGPYGARFAGELVAFRQGKFAAPIKLRPLPNDPDFVGSVAREHAIGVTTGAKFLIAAWRGVPVTAFAASFLDTSTAIFTLEGSGLRRPADLVGKRLGYRKASEGEAIFDAMMAQLGLPRSQVTKVSVSDGLEALRAQQVDAVIASVEDQPGPSGGDSLRLNVIRPQDYGIHVPGLVYFASSDLIRDRPSIVGDVLGGLIRGWQFVYADYAKSVPVVVDFSPGALNADRVKFELQEQRSLVLPAGGRIADYDESRWRTLRDILIFAKLEEEGVPLGQAVNYQFLRDVYRRSPDLAAKGAWSVER